MRLTRSHVKRCLQNQAARYTHIPVEDVNLILKVIPDGAVELEDLSEAEIFESDAECLTLQAVHQRVAEMVDEGATLDDIHDFLKMDEGMRFLLTGQFDLKLN